MPLNPETFYLSAVDYRSQTTVPNLITPLTDDSVELLLLETMAVIDAYIGEGWTPHESDQEFIFPRSVDEDLDGESVIPRSVSLATRLIADAIMEERRTGVLPHLVASEGNEGHSYSKTTQSMNELEFQVIPPTALALLQKFRRIGGQWAVEEYVL